MEDLLRKIEKFIDRHDLLAAGGRVLVACSGGPDSLALLSLFLDMREKHGFIVWAAHFNHGIRGEAAREDARFVADFCAAREVPFYLGEEDVPAYAAHEGLSLETAARKQRYSFLRRIARQMGPDAVIATAHQADDQAETVLMRLLRGTGIEGLAAMRPKAGGVIRPLLGTTRLEIEAYCESKGLEPRWDSTNEVPDATRNKLRLQILPMLRQEINPSVNEALCRLASIAAETGDFLRGKAGAAWGDTVRFVADAWEIDCRMFQKRPAAVRQAMLRMLAERLHIQTLCGEAHYEALHSLVMEGRTGARLMLPDRVTAEAGYGAVRLLREKDATSVADWPAMEIVVPGETRIEKLGLSIITTMPETCPGELGPTAVAVDAGALPGKWMVRPRRPGDVIEVENGTQKVKKLLIDRKVPRKERGLIPIFTDDDRIFWVGGIRQAALGRVTEDTQRIVCLMMCWDSVPSADALMEEPEIGLEDREEENQV